MFGGVDVEIVNGIVVDKIFDLVVYFFDYEFVVGVEIGKGNVIGVELVVLVFGGV